MPAIAVLTDGSLGFSRSLWVGSQSVPVLTVLGTWTQTFRSLNVTTLHEESFVYLLGGGGGGGRGHFASKRTKRAEPQCPTLSPHCDRADAAPTPPLIFLHAGPGSGKSTAANELADRLTRHYGSAVIRFLAPSGIAASNLRRGSTCHHALGLRIGDGDGPCRFLVVVEQGRGGRLPEI